MKQTVEHTPKPWFASLDGIYAKDRVTRIATVHNLEGEANKRFIAIAPELFDFVEAYANGELVDRTSAVHLISKATGQP